MLSSVDRSNIEQPVSRYVAITNARIRFKTASLVLKHPYCYDMEPHIGKQARKPVVLRVAKQDAAYLYALLEAQDGVVNFSTLPSEKSAGFRDIYVFSTESMYDEMLRMIAQLRESVGFQVIDESNSPPAVS